MSDNPITEENFIDFKCPHCGEDVSFPESCAGLARDCFSCMQPLIVPCGKKEAGLIPLPITTSRLVLRKFRGSDWKNLLELVSDDDFSNASRLALDSEESIVRWLDSDATITITTPNAVFALAVELNEKAKVIGFLSVYFSDAERLQTVLGLVIDKAHQKCGLGTEAIKAMLGFCFEGLSLHRVQTSFESTNAAARRLFEKCGFRREGEFLQDHKVGGRWLDTVSYAILRDEWSAAKTP